MGIIVCGRRIVFMCYDRLFVYAMPAIKFANYVPPPAFKFDKSSILIMC